AVTTVSPILTEPGSPRDILSPFLRWLSRYAPPHKALTLARRGPELRDGTPAVSHRSCSHTGHRPVVRQPLRAAEHCERVARRRRAVRRPALGFFQRAEMKAGLLPMPAALSASAPLRSGLAPRPLCSARAPR